MEVSPIAANRNPLGGIDLNILCLMNAQIDERWQGADMVLPFNRLYLVEEGSGMLNTGGGAVEMVPGMAYLVPAGAPLTYRCSGYMKKIYLHFNLLGPDRYDLLRGCHRVGVVPLPPNLTEHLRRYGGGSSPEDNLRVRQLFYSLLCEFLPQYDLAGRPLRSYSEHVRETIDYIRENLSAQLRVEELARRRFLSCSSLSAMFRREVGVSIGRYMDDQLMMEALLRISGTRDSIQAISRGLGFSDQSYFARRFRLVHGVSPTECRQRNLM